MKIITLANQKGGVGKSSTARLFSTWLSSKGHSVVILDFDDEQGTVRKWWNNREADSPEMLEVDPDPTDYQRVFAELRQAGDVDYLVIDTPPRKRSWIANVMEESDLVIFPTGPSKDDIGPLKETIAAAKERNIHYGIVMVKSSKNTKIDRKARESLSILGPVCVWGLDNRVAYPEAFEDGLTVIESNSGPAKEEADKVCEFIMELMQ